jgi:signal transduction histidine kinase
VLLNLLLNARKSLADWPEPKIAVSTRSIQGRVEICVEDNGPGVPEAIRDRIFDPFFTTREASQGTGLGLSIAFDIVRGHNGELVHEAPADGGARFVVKLPIRAGALGAPHLLSS